MTTVNGIGATTMGTTSPVPSAEKAASTSNLMDKDGFLQLFLATLQNQDPTSPMESGEMMSQMSQLTLVEQITNLGEVVETLKTSLATNPMDAAVNYLGKEVTGIDSNGESVEGIVDSAALNNGTLELMINNKNVSIANISKVANYSSDLL